MKYIVIIIFTLVGCASPPPVVDKPAVVTPTTKPPTPVLVPTPPRAGGQEYQILAWPQIDYTALVYKHLEKSPLIGTTPKDLQLFCPKLTKTNIHFWAQLISAMAKRESNFKTDTKYTESFKDGTGAYVVSRGLLQISIESGKGYNKALKGPQDLHNPDINLKTGVLILERWVLKDNYIGATDTANLGGARYWAVLRKNRGDSRTWIEGYMKSLPMCKN